jgi:hypothetical protein
MPSLSPDSVEVVELVRGRAFVVVRTHPCGVVVLDEAGRLVRGRERLAAIGRHVRALAQVEAVLAAAQLDRRLEHAARSSALLGRLERALPGKELRRTTACLLAEIELYQTRLVALLDEHTRAAPATERTLRRTIGLLNDAARADRGVVRTACALAGALTADVTSDRASPAASLRRWVVARLSTPDVPYFYAEFDADRDGFVKDFVAAARA